MALLFRIVVIALIIYIVYKGVRYLTDPKRKLDEAFENCAYYFYDDVKNVRKNFFISYKCALFEGEKYLGTTENAFDVVSIFVFVHDPMKLQGFTKEDFLYSSNIPLVYVIIPIPSGIKSFTNSNKSLGKT